MFSKANLENKKTETIIGPSVKVEGTFTAEGDVLLEGEFYGELKTKGHLTVAESAKIKANVEAATMLMAGEISGNVKCSGQLELKASGKIFGDVEAGILSVETGAILRGKCLVGEEAKK